MISLKNLKFVLIALFAVSFLASCDKDLAEESEESSYNTSNGRGDEDSDTEDGENEDKDYFDCFEINYPVEILLSDGSQITVDNDSLLYNMLEIDEEENEEPSLTFVFPITVVLLEGTETTIESMDYFFELEDGCEEEEEEEEEEDDDDDDDDDDEQEWDDLFEGECFSFIYPITFDISDGANFTINSDEELYSFIENYEEQELDFEELPIPQFPISITLKDGMQVQIEDLDQLISQLQECDD